MSLSSRAATWTASHSLLLASAITKTLERGAPGPGWAYGQALSTFFDGLLEAHASTESASPTARVHELVSRPPDPVRLRALFEKIEANVARVEAQRQRRDDYNPWSSVAALIRDTHGKERSSPRPIELPLVIPKPNPWLYEVTLDRAKEALASLQAARVAAEWVPPDDERWRILEGAKERCRKATPAPGVYVLGVYKYGVACERCRYGWIEALRPELHLLACPAHRAWQELELLRAAVVALAGLFPEALAGFEPGSLPARPENARPEPGPREAGPRDPLAEAEATIVVWERALDAAHVRCPGCGHVAHMENLATHLKSCPGHVAAQASTQLRGQLQARLDTRGRASLEIIVELARAEARLRELLDACEKFRADFGWSDGCTYTKDGALLPWRASVVAAAELAAGSGGDPPRDDAIDEALPESLRALRARLKKVRSALADLVSACRTLDRTMDDGPDPRWSVLSERGLEAWSAEIARARAAIDASFHGEEP